MRQFKKILAGFLAAAMVMVLLTGCGSESQKTKSDNVFKALKEVLGDSIQLETDAALQKQAEAFGRAIANGENVQVEQGIAYAEVPGVAAVWDLIKADDAVVMPIRYDKTSNKWVELWLPYSENEAAMTRAIAQADNEIVSTLKKYHSNKVGIAVVKVDGNDFVVIVGNIHTIS